MQKSVQMTRAMWITCSTGKPHQRRHWEILKHDLLLRHMKGRKRTTILNFFALIYICDT